ncbi:transglutaminase-like cysteine peptidase [Rhizobiales bacterium]|nr:transglutaminase-like cysteine peptidase [Hongsoonwoonella zoysiae]
MSIAVFPGSALAQEADHKEFASVAAISSTHDDWRVAAISPRHEARRFGDRRQNENFTTKKSSNAGRGVFGSVAVPFGSLPSKKDWQAVFPQVKRATFVDCASSANCNDRSLDLAKTVHSAKIMPFSQKLALINVAVNHAVHYVPDNLNYRKLDHWAKPDETLNAGRGDCEDYAILKMAALSAAGIPLNSMSIVVLQDTRRSLFHAVLAVSTNQGHYILDNLHDSVMKDSELGDYMPLYSMSAERSWIHGIRQSGKTIASLSSAPADFSPGEGIAANSRFEAPAAGL